MACLICWIESHQGTAAWVQAIGSIAAIAGSVAVVFIQRKLQLLDQRKKENERDAALVDVVAELATQIGKVCVVCTDFPDGHDEGMVFYADPPQHLRELRQLLFALPIDRITNAGAFQVLIDLRIIADKAVKLLEGTSTNRFTARGTRNDFVAFAEEARGYADYLQGISAEIRAGR